MKKEKKPAKKYICECCDTTYSSPIYLYNHIDKRPKHCKMLMALRDQNSRLELELEIAKQNQTINKRGFYINKIPIEDLVPDKENQERLREGIEKLIRYIEGVTIAGLRDEVFSEYDFFISEAYREAIKRRTEREQNKINNSEHCL